MSNYDDSGILFKNDKKEKESHPEYKGNATVDGVEYWISSWIKKGKNGSFMTLKFTPKDAVHKKGIESAKESVGGFDDELPF